MCGSVRCCGTPLKPLLPVNCSHAVPLSPSRPRQNKTYNNRETDAGSQTNTSARGSPQTHNPTDGNKSLAKLGVQIAMIVCIGLLFFRFFVMPVIPPVCYNGVPCHLNTFVKKGQIHTEALASPNATFRIVWDMRRAVLNDSLRARACLRMSIKGLLYSSIKQVDLSGKRQQSSGFK